MGILDGVIGFVDDFLFEHPGVKSAWRLALTVTLAAVAAHLGLGEFVIDLAGEITP